MVDWELVPMTQVEIDEFDANVAANPAFQNEEGLKVKMKRLREIDKQLKAINAPWVIITKPSLIAINDAKIIELNTEATEIQNDIGENYESSLVDDIYTSLFM